MLLVLTNGYSRLMSTVDRLMSKDGTTIRYITLGSGRSVIVIPGVMSMAADYQAFAHTLAQTLAVHIIERRGHGLSGPQGEDYAVVKECEDIVALQEKTGASFLFGHSFGGLVALEVARNNKSLTKIAVYEPAVSVDGSIPVAWAAEYRQRLDENKYLDAFAGFSIAMGPDRARKTPRWMMKLILPFFLKRYPADQVPALLLANLREHVEIAGLDNSYSNYREVSASVLLMTGGKSGLGWVAPAIRELSAVLPSSELKTFARLDHFGPGKSGASDVARAAKEHFLRGSDF